MSQKKTDAKQFELDEFTKRAIRKKARQLVGHAGLRKQDREDIEQELMLELLQSWPSFDPQKAHRNVFVTTVIERTAAQILRDRRAQKRDFTRSCSLEDLVEQEENSERCIAEREREWCRQNEQSDLAIDLNEILAKLPDELRDVAYLLKKSHSVTQVARELGVSSSTVKRRMLELRERLEEYGISGDDTF